MGPVREHCKLLKAPVLAAIVDVPRLRRKVLKEDKELVPGASHHVTGSKELPDACKVDEELALSRGYFVWKPDLIVLKSPHPVDEVTHTKLAKCGGRPREYELEQERMI